MFRVGIISDTHGLLRPAAKEFLCGCDSIIHAGDIGNARVLEELALIAPTVAVRGNADKGAWGESLPETEFLQLGALFVYVIHELGHLDLDPKAAGVCVVVSGHSHLPSIQERDGVLYLNPGSAGPRRFGLPISVGELRVQGGKFSARTVELACTKHVM